MTAGVSNRVADAFDNTAKAEYRAKHLEALREAAPELWEDDDRRRLRGAWLELMGATGWRTLELLVGAGALSEENFVGVDFDADRIDAYRTRYPRARWLAGDVLDLVNSSELEDVSVLHYDGYEAAGSARMAHVAEQLTTVLRRSVETFGAAAVVWNADLDACRLQGAQPAAALRAHARTLAALLTGVAGERRLFTQERLLPTGADTLVTDTRFVGAAGSFDIYRGKSTGHRMVCLRVVIR